MHISFFEEFPSKENLAKIKYVSFPTKLYLAAHSLEEFDKIKISSPELKEKIYWPILQRKEGYWFSPFSQRKALQRVLQEIQKSSLPILWDAELPTHTNPLLYLTQAPFFLGNRRDIRNVIAQRKNISTAEYFPSSPLSERILYILGLSFKTRNHFPIKMVYSSMHDFGESFIRKEIKQAKKIFGKRLHLGLGTLTHGIRGDEPAILPEILERDLGICKELEIEEVILFRLGGMNKEYRKIITPYAKQEHI